MASRRVSRPFQSRAVPVLFQKLVNPTRSNCASCATGAPRRGAALRQASPSLAVVDASGIRNAVRFAARPRAHYRHPKGEKIFDSWQISASVNGNERRHGFFSQPFTQVGLFLNMYMRVWWRYGCGFQFYSPIYLYMCVLLFYIKLHLLAWKLFVFAHRGGKCRWGSESRFFLDPLISVSSFPDPWTSWHAPSKYTAEFPLSFCANVPLSRISVNFHVSYRISSLLHAIRALPSAMELSVDL